MIKKLYILNYIIKISNKLKIVYFLFLLIISISLNAQTKYAPIAFTSFTFPQSTRSIGLGAAGTAITPDASSITLNPARMILIDDEKNISLDTYVLPSLSRGNVSKYLNLSYIYNHDFNSFGISLKSYSLGDINQVTDDGEISKISLPDEYKITVADAMKLTKNTSIGISIDYLNKPQLLYSNVPGTSFVMGGLGVINKTFLSRLNDQELLTGMAIENMGALTKDRYFLPTTLSLGGTFMQGHNNATNKSKYLFGVEFSKLLVPSLPIYDSEGKILKGTDPNSLTGIQAITNSLFDDPYGKNLAKWRIQLYSEYYFLPQFSFRTGYSYENIIIGNRNYFTLGAGYQYKNDVDNFNIDLAYVIPANNLINIYKNIFSFSIKYKLGSRW
jgi:hypothetical protein